MEFDERNCQPTFADDEKERHPEKPAAASKLKNKAKKNNLDSKNHWNTNEKRRLACLVMAKIHSNQNTRTATDNGCTHKRCLRDTPARSFGFLLIGKHKYKSGCID